MSERKEDRIIRIHKNLLPLKIEKRAKHFPGAFGGRVCVCVCDSSLQDGFLYELPLLNVQRIGLSNGFKSILLQIQILPINLLEIKII